MSLPRELRDRIFYFVFHPQGPVRLIAPALRELHEDEPSYISFPEHVEPTYSLVGEAYGLDGLPSWIKRSVDASGSDRHERSVNGDNDDHVEDEKDEKLARHIPDFISEHIGAKFGDEMDSDSDGDDGEGEIKRFEHLRTRFRLESLEKLDLSRLRVSREVHVEALESLYGAFTFVIDAESNHANMFLQSLPPKAQKSIKTLAFSYDALQHDHARQKAWLRDKTGGNHCSLPMETEFGKFLATTMYVSEGHNATSPSLKRSCRHRKTFQTPDT